jgi:AcrR family transcriptional regulator
MPTPRRHEILRAAKRLFCHYGPHKTTVTDIAREANCAVGSVYLDFQSKEEIVEELSREEWNGVLASMRERATKKAEAFGTRFQGVLLVRTMAFLDVRDASAHQKELFFCQIACVRTARARFEEDEALLLADLFTLARDKGECDVKDAGRIARTVQRCIASLSPPRVFEQSRDEAELATKEVAKLLLSGLLAR